MDDQVADDSVLPYAEPGTETVTQHQRAFRLDLDARRNLGPLKVVACVVGVLSVTWFGAALILWLTS
jgi:hypothetical protein